MATLEEEDDQSAHARARDSWPQPVPSADPALTLTPRPCQIWDCHVEEFNDSLGSTEGFGISCLGFRI